MPCLNRAPDGTILYSDEPTLIGRRFELDEDFYRRSACLFEPSAHYEALFAIGIVLFVLTFIINLSADLIVRGVRKG